MPHPPPEVTPEIVRGDLTEDLLQAYSQSPALAVDTETMGLNPLRDRLCLVQLCDRAGRAALVQIPREALSPAPPLEARPPRPKRLLDDPPLLRVFHFPPLHLATPPHHPLLPHVSPHFTT